MNDLTMQEKTEIAGMIDMKLRELVANDGAIKAEIVSNPEYLKKMLQENIIDEVKADLKRRKAILSIDYEAEKQTFLRGKQSGHTRRAYTYALKDFENYIHARGIENPLFCNRAQADDWIYEQTRSGKAAASVRRNIAAASAFFSFMERRSEGRIQNVFLGTKAAPKKRAAKQIEKEIPTTDLELFRKDIETIIDSETDLQLKAMIAVMAYRGLRCGSFFEMSLHGNKFFTQSKEKQISGVLPESCMKLIEAAGVKRNAPFSDWNTARVSSTFQYHVAKLYAAGKISYKYSCHDMRHFFALEEYTANKDIYNLSKLLNHSSIAVTEIYLRGLKVIE